MMLDRSYHEQETLDEANIRIDNFLVEHQYKVDQHMIDEFADSNYLEFQPYLDKEDLVRIIKGKLEV